MRLPQRRILPAFPHPPTTTPPRSRVPRGFLCAALLLACLGLGPAARGQCPEEPPLQNYTGGGSVVCPCFVPGEEAGAVFDLPPGDFPIEILRVGVGWGSQSGMNPDQLEEAIHIYEGGLPDPGVPIFTLPGPVLIDGGINQFDLEPLPGQILVNSGPFTVTLEFLNQNSEDPFASSVVHDGNGCQVGKNAVFAIPGGWTDACLLGVNGDWVFFVVYRPASCPGVGSGRVPDGATLPGVPLTVEEIAGGNLLLSWGASCDAGDTDYEVHEGTLGSFYSHAGKLCSTAGATAAVVAPPAHSTYYLVVPRDASVEGSYGLDSGGGERPPSTSGVCLPQVLAVCP